MSQAEDETKSRVGDFVMRAAFNRYAALEWRRARDRAYAEELLAVHCDQAPDGTYVVRNPKQFMRAVKLEKKARAFIAANHNQWASIEFLGCYDTVAALGLPLPVLGALVNVIPGFQHRFHNLSLAKSVRHACHALAIDDERKAFAPTLWDQPSEDQTLRQVWFTGMHTDVGGGYADRGLADIALAWMLRQAHERGLLLFPSLKEAIVEDLTDVMHDSRGKWWAGLVYRKKVRSWEREAPPVVHESVLLRAKAETIGVWRNGRPATGRGEDYRPWVLGGDVDATSGGYEVEPWVPFDPEELLAAQELKWQEWMRAVEARDRQRTGEAQRAWAHAQVERGSG